jgi:hypothetical protein
MVQAVHRIAEADCPHLWTKFSRLCGTAPTMRPIIHRAMLAGNMRQNVQEPEQLDASPSGNMTTVRTAFQGAKSARNTNASCVPDTPDDSVVLVGIKQWKHLFLVITSKERAWQYGGLREKVEFGGKTGQQAPQPARLDPG